MSQTLSQICKPIQSSIAKLEGQLHAYLKSDIALIEEVAAYVIANGGKRLRPVLAMLAAELCQGDAAAALPYACAVEYIHTASLLHDDVVDNALIRRGKPSANAKWGNAVSVLVGDFFYCRASELLVKSGNLEILDIISSAITRTTEGEVLEISKAGDVSISEDDYLQIIYHKTALLMAATCETGAALRPGFSQERAALRQFGDALGMAFQLADDVLDYVSTDHQFGKQNGTDFKEGRLTLPLIYTLQEATPAERDRLKQLLSAKSIHTSELADVNALMDKYHTVKRALEKARAYSASARQALAVFPESAAKRALVELSEYVIERSY